ncbi:MAG TPA: redoxin domain-containing protein [Opitutaceae bacterium]
MRRSSAVSRRAAQAILLSIFLSSVGLPWANADTSASVGHPDPVARIPQPEWFMHLHIADLDGAPLHPSGRWYVVFFMGQECPVSNVSIPVMNKLAAEFAHQGFAFIGAYVDPTADLATLRGHAADYRIGFSTADDRDHRLARAAGATYTPEVGVFSAAGTVLYRGRIDDRVGDFGAARPAATHDDLREVLLAIASGSDGPFKGIPGYGCAIPEAVKP